VCGPANVGGEKYWELGKLGEKLGKEMRETLSPLTRLARRDKYSIPPSPKPRKEKQGDRSSVRQLESKDSLATIGSARDVREFTAGDVTSPRMYPSELSTADMIKLTKTSYVYLPFVHRRGRLRRRARSGLDLSDEEVTGYDET